MMLRHRRAHLLSSVNSHIIFQEDACMGQSEQFCRHDWITGLLRLRDADKLQAIIEGSLVENIDRAERKPASADFCADVAVLP